MTPTVTHRHDGSNVAPTIEIIVSAETAAALRITTPELVF